MSQSELRKSKYRSITLFIHHINERLLHNIQTATIAPNRYSPRMAHARDLKIHFEVSVLVPDNGPNLFPLSETATLKVSWRGEAKCEDADDGGSD